MKNFKHKIVNRFLLTVVIIGSFLTANAQGGEFGLRFMPTFSSFDVKNSSGGVVESSVTLGYGAGLLLGFHFNDHVGIQGEVIYSTINQKYSEVDIEQKVTLKYINIPLLLSLNTSKESPVNINFVVGPQFGVSIGSSFDGVVTQDSVSLDPIVSVKKGDLGIAYGAGFDFGLTPSNLFRLGIGFRGVTGLVDISDNSNSQTTDGYYVIDRTHIQTYAVYMGLSVLF